MPSECTSHSSECTSHSSESTPHSTDLSLPRETRLEPLPPRVTPISTAAILDPTMPPPLFRSYARLYAVAWRQAYRCTDALDFDAELVPLLGVRPTQARQHLRYLRFAKLLDWKSDGANRYVIHFPGPGGALESDAGALDHAEIALDSKNPPPVVVDGLNHDSEDTQQQLKDSAKADFRPTAERTSQSAECTSQPGSSPPAQFQQSPASRFSAEEQEVYQLALRFLRRAGVWPDVATRIADKLVENHRRGHAYLPSLADVLGWMAYCFADRQKNKIAQPAAVLAANLNANRCCPEEYRPPRVCAACGFAEGFCQCQGEPDYHYPTDFLDYAFKRRYDTYTTSIWGVCLSCHGFPCVCDED